MSEDEVAHKLDVLHQHCATEGRDPATIRNTILAMGNPLDDVDAFLTSMERYAKLGIDTVDFMPMGDPVAFTTGVMQRLTQRLAELG
jgi:hypothetical protein